MIRKSVTLWQRLRDIGRGTLPFDHAEILATAVERLRGKLRYTNLAANLLPDTFRIEELQQAYEAVLERPVNLTNFRNKLLKIGLIKKVGVLDQAPGSLGGRPPHLYSFVQEHLQAQDRDFL